MISKLKEAVTNNQPIMEALQDLKINTNNNEFLTQQQISNRLRLFFENDLTKKQFLLSLWEIVRKVFAQDGIFLKKIKLLLLIHIIVSSQVARAELSKILITKEISLNSKVFNDHDQTLSTVCQNYYYYIYKLASQTTFINEEIKLGDLLIYFTLSNQSHIAISLQQVIEKVQDYERNPLMANIAKFLYYDLQDIYIFIIKDVKSLIEDNSQIGRNRDQVLELYKEVMYNYNNEIQCQVLQHKMIEFYLFNRSFPHFSQMMPPHSLQINVKQIKQLEDNKPIQQSLTQITIFEDQIKQPLTTKNKQSFEYNFCGKKQLPQTPDYTFSD